MTALILFAAGCGSDDPATDVEDPTTTAVVTDPPTTAPPTTGTAPPTTGTAPTTTATAPSTTEPSSQPEPALPDIPVVIDDGAFGSVAEMAAAADLVVVGTVTEETSLGRPRSDVDPAADEFLGLTVRVDTVLKGDPLTEVMLGWDAYAADESGQRVGSNVMNGIPVPHVGDQLLLFLKPVDDQFQEFLGGFPTHAAVRLDGIGFLDGDAVSITDSSSPESAVLTGKTLDQIAAEL